MDFYLVKVWVSPEKCCQLFLKNGWFHTCTVTIFIIYLQSYGLWCSLSWFGSEPSLSSSPADSTLLPNIESVHSVVLFRLLEAENSKHMVRIKYDTCDSLRLYEPIEHAFNLLGTPAMPPRLLLFVPLPILPQHMLCKTNSAFDS